MSDLFGGQPASKPKTGPPEKKCAGCNGPRAHCGDAGQWYCVACVSPLWFPKNRGAK